MSFKMIHYLFKDYSVKRINKYYNMPTMSHKSKNYI